MFGVVNFVKSKSNKLIKLFQEGVRKRSFTWLTSKVMSCKDQCNVLLLEFITAREHSGVHLPGCCHTTNYLRLDE